MKAVKTINPKYGVPTSKPRGSNVLRVAEVAPYEPKSYVPLHLKSGNSVISKSGMVNNTSASLREVDKAYLNNEDNSLNGVLYSGEVGFIRMVGRIESVLKRRKIAYEYADGYFCVDIDKADSDYYLNYWIGVDNDEKCFVVCDVEEREIMCVDANELSHIIAWLEGYNDFDGRGKLVLRTDLID